jgi:hypothetical protein
MSRGGRDAAASCRREGRIMTKHAEPPPASAQPMAPMEWWNAASYGGLLDAYGGWMRNAVRVQEESMHFARVRMQRNIEAATGFAACRTPSELIAMQSQYASHMMGDYLAEGRKLVGLLKE